MLKIIKEGKRLPKNKRYYIKKCSSCASKFIYQLDDRIFYLHEFDKVKCPKCGNYCTVFVGRRYRKKVDDTQC